VPSGESSSTKTTSQQNRMGDCVEQLDERHDIVPLVEGRNDHGQLRPLWRRAFLGLTDGGDIIPSR
jgi:hypothetical protein